MNNRRSPLTPSSTPSARPTRHAWVRRLGLIGVLAWTAVGAQADDAARVEEIVQGKCFICHGLNGESSTPNFPRLAGQNASYLARQLADYKSGKRRSDTMQPMVSDLSDKDFALLGTFFAAQPTVAHTVLEPDMVGAGKRLFTQGKDGGPSCASCHGEEAHGSEGSPRLAGQHAQYLVTQMQQFQKRARPESAVMGKVAAKLTDRDMRAVAAYLSGLK
jgi:cytochrome c553